MLVMVDVIKMKRDAKPLLHDELPVAANLDTDGSVTKTSEAWVD